MPEDAAARSGHAACQWVIAHTYPAAVDPNLPAKLCAPADVALCGRLLPRPMVFTNGVFDLLHRGHVTYLTAARALGRSLVVGLNSDMSVLAMDKGPGHPLNNEIDRAWVLDALSAVTMIVLFDEPKPLALLRELQPEIFVKGGDYSEVRDLEETRLLQSWGARAVALDFLPGYSTRALVERVRAGTLHEHSPA
jgi:rfaE bifunctional protein nucleotidyltransferase chain/domain